MGSSGDVPGRLFDLPDRYRDLGTRAKELAESVSEHAAVADEADRVDPVMLSALRESELATVTIAAQCRR